MERGGEAATGVEGSVPATPPDDAVAAATALAASTPMPYFFFGRSVVVLMGVPGGDPDPGAVLAAEGGEDVTAGDGVGRVADGAWDVSRGADSLATPLVASSFTVEVPPPGTPSE